jgi:hypothetical protein
MPSESAVLLVGVVASKPAFASVSRDFGGWLREPVRKQGIVHPYIDGSDLRHTENSRSGGQDTSDPCIPRYVSIIASYQRNVV